MKPYRPLSILTLVYVAAFLISADSASAYIDPGTGSFMLQLLIASVLGTGYAMKLYWHKLKIFVGSLFSKNSDRS